MVRQVVASDGHCDLYTGYLPDGYYTYPPTFEEQNDPEYLLKADEVRRLAVEWDTDWFEIFTEDQSVKYLATMDLYGRQEPINHGRVEIDDAGFLSDGTPVEDYGMYIIRDKPLPTCTKKLTRMFMRLLRDRTTPED